MGMRGGKEGGREGGRERCDTLLFFYGSFRFGRVMMVLLTMGEKREKALRSVRGGRSILFGAWGYCCLVALVFCLHALFSFLPTGCISFFRRNAGAVP